MSELKTLLKKISDVEALAIAIYKNIGLKKYFFHIFHTTAMSDICSSPWLKLTSKSWATQFSSTTANTRSRVSSLLEQSKWKLY